MQEKIIPQPGKEEELRKATDGRAWSLGAYRIPESPELLGKVERDGRVFWYFSGGQNDYYYKTEFDFEMDMLTRKNKKNKCSGDIFYMMTRGAIKKESKKMH